MAVDSIAFEGDPIEAGQHIAMARKCLDGLRAKLAGSGATTASTQMRLSDRAYVVAIIGPGIAKAVITAGYPGREASADQQRAVAEVPDFLSGVALRSSLELQDDGTDTMASFWPTTACAVAFGLPSGVSMIERLALKPADELEGRWKEPGGLLRPAQTMRVVPTLYSGKMRQVVQMLLGFGKEPAPSRYDSEQPLLTRYGRTAERRQVLPLYEQQVRANGRQVLYDWSFARTHGITTASDGALWLIEISVQSGVLAMPLPLNEVTRDDPRFRAKLEAMGDDAGLTALDAFGGWPTGEPFPTGEALTQAKRAGYVQELIPPDGLDALYDNHSPYSTAMGWSFNQRGTEAHVTAWRYESDRVQRSVWYAIQLAIGATMVTPAAPEARGVIRRIERLATDGSERRWLFAKANRLSRSQCQEILQRASAADSLAMLRAIELEPIATASGTMRRMQEGKLYWPGAYQPWIQFPEPMLGYCVSHKMQPEFGTHVTPAPRCETVVHVLHHGDQLKTVSFLSDPRAAEPADEDTFEPCMYQGSWRQTISTGGTSVQTTMFTSDADDRAEAHPSLQTTEITSVAVGYTRVVVVDDIGYPPAGQMGRVRQFKRNIRISIESGPVIGATIRVPFFDRSAYYYASYYGFAEASYSESWVYSELADPHMYPTWRNFPGYTPYSGNQPRGEHPSGCGAVSRRTVLGEIYQPFPCSDDADQGSWASVCDDADAMIYSIQLPPLPEATFRQALNQVRLSVKLYNATEESPITVATIAQAGLTTNEVAQWLATSPDPVTFAKQYIAATQNTLGDREQTQYNPRPNASEFNVTGPLIQAMRHNQAAFIGVVDA